MPLTPERAAHAATVLRYVRPGDMLIVQRCMGMFAEYVYFGPSKNEYLNCKPTLDTARMEKRYGTRGYGESPGRGDGEGVHPVNVTHINRIPVDCISMLAPGHWPANNPEPFAGVSQVAGAIGKPGGGPDESWVPIGSPWPAVGMMFEGCWSRDGQFSYGFVQLVRRAPDGSRATWRDADGAIVPFGPDFWKPC